GKKIENFTVKDAEGKAWSLYDLKDKRAVVLVFLSFECPVSTSYSQLPADLAKTTADRGVAFVGLGSNPDDDANQLTRLARDYRIPFPVLKDAQFAAADALKAEVTPEAFVLDRHFILRYHGRIDDGYAARLKKNVHIMHHDLRQALDDVLAD